MPRAKRERPPDPDRLVRRSAGDLHTEDGRFEVSSTGGAGRWYVTDTERHDGLGLALVLGPFGTLVEVRAAIEAQRGEPAGDDGPLPEPMEHGASPRQRRPRRDEAAAPAAEPEPVPEPEPEPPPRPPVRITRGRWRPTKDERDSVVAVVRRVDDAWLSGAADSMGDDLHESVVVLLPEQNVRLDGRPAVIEHHRAFAADAHITAWVEDDLTIDVVGDVAVLGYRFTLEREVDGERRQEDGTHLWVLTRSDAVWLVAWHMVTA